MTIGGDRRVGSLLAVTHLVFRVLTPIFITECYREPVMAKNTGEGHRVGSVKDRTQTETPNGNEVKRNTVTGQFMDQKEDGKPFKGVAKEPDGRRK